MQAGQDQFQISKPVRLVLAVVLMGLLVFLDYSSGPQINLSILYLLPICLAAWEAGFWAGLILSIASAVIWFMAEYGWDVPQTRSMIPYWNALVRLEFFVLTVMLLCNIKRLNCSLEEQTTSLKAEIAERRQAEEALAESQKIFRLITENVSDLITVLNQEGRRLYSSPSCANRPEEMELLLNADYFEDIVPEDRAAVRGVFEAVLSTGKNRRAEYRVRSGRRWTRHMESEWSAIREGAGAARNVVVVSRDVTARKRMELLYTNEKDTLEMIAQGKPLHLVLQQLTQKVALWSEEILCSILVQNADEEPILHEGSAFADSVPAEGARSEPGRAPGRLAEDGAEALGQHSGIECAWSRYRVNALEAGFELVYSKEVISSPGETLGVLSIYSRDPGDPEAMRLKLFEKIAHVAAIALERQRSEETLRHLSGLLLNAQESERRRVARELHDSVSQMLSAIGYRIESAMAQMPRDNPLARQEITKARFLLKRAIHEVHSISEALRPSELDDLGLVAAIRELIEDFKERTQLEVHVLMDLLPERLSTEIELALYRIVQEALMNVEKHAEATSVTLALKWDGSFVTLQIKDNGRGLATVGNGATGKRKGLGLMDMRERCASLGGAFTIRSEPRSGTEVAVRVPMRLAKLTQATALA